MKTDKKSKKNNNLIKSNVDSELQHVVCYKIMDRVVDGKDYKFKFLFHGVNGTRTLNFDTWVKAERKWAGEGGNKYWTGFHVLLSRENAEKYFKRFTDESKTRIIVKCLARNLTPKASSKGLVYLAEEIMMPSSL